MKRKKTMADILRAAIRNAGMTEQQIAIRAGVAPSVVWRFVHQGAQLKIDNLDKIAGVVGLELRPVEKPAATKRKGR